MADCIQCRKEMKRVVVAQMPSPNQANALHLYCCFHAECPNCMLLQLGLEEKDE